MTLKGLSSPGKYIALKVLKFKPGGNTALYLQLYVAFFLSGVLHAMGDFKVHRQWYAGGSLKFFCLQAVIITLEDAGLWLGRRLSIKSAWGWRVIGYVWVIAWFVYTGPDWLGPMVAGRGKMALTVPFSLILGVHGYHLEKQSSLLS